MPDSDRFELSPVAVSGLARGDCVVVDGQVVTVVSKRLHWEEPRGIDLTYRDEGGPVTAHFEPGAGLDRVIVVAADGSRYPLVADPKRPPPLGRTLFGEDASFDRDDKGELASDDASHNEAATTSIDRQPCSWCGGMTVAGSTCPGSIACPHCRAKPGAGCRRPSGHPCEMHAGRWQEAERRDAEEGITYEAEEVRPAHGDLFDLLREHAEADRRWQAERTEEARHRIWETWNTAFSRADPFLSSDAPGEWPDSLRTDRCRPLVIERVENDAATHPRPFARGACTGCGWVGRIIEETEGVNAWNVAAEDAHDHAWPGWRDLPPVYKANAAATHEKKAVEAFLKRARSLYPPGWVEEGGPIVTWRTPGGTRHHDGAPNGGWDLGRVDPRFPTCETCGELEGADGSYDGPDKPLPPTMCATCTTPEERAAIRQARQAEAETPAVEALTLFDPLAPPARGPGLSL